MEEHINNIGGRIVNDGPLANALFEHLREYYNNGNIKDRGLLDSASYHNGRHTQQEATSTDDRQNQPSS
jgi:hypothetical protein